jgi:hypothetical protein
VIDQISIIWTSDQFRCSSKYQRLETFRYSRPEPFWFVCYNNQSFIRMQFLVFEWICWSAWVINNHDNCCYHPRFVIFPSLNISRGNCVTFYWITKKCSQSWHSKVENGGRQSSSAGRSIDSTCSQETIFKLMRNYFYQQRLDTFGFRSVQ